MLVLHNCLILGLRNSVMDQNIMQNKIGRFTKEFDN